MRGSALRSCSAGAMLFAVAVLTASCATSPSTGAESYLVVVVVTSAEGTTDGATVTLSDVHSSAIFFSDAPGT